MDRWGSDQEKRYSELGFAWRNNQAKSEKDSMRVAICISGQPRNLVQNWEHLHHSLIRPNNADVFIHTWVSPDNPKAVHYPIWHENKTGEILSSDAQPEHLDLWIKNHIQPKGLWIEPPVESFPHLKDDYKKYCVNGHIPYPVWSMYASIFKANELRRMYENKHGFKYDYVIRTRFDVSMRIRLDVSHLDPSILYTGDSFDSWLGISDHVVVSGSDIMNIHADTYLYLDHLVEDLEVEIQGENLMGAYVRLAHGLHPHKIIPTDIDHLRDKGLNYILRNDGLRIPFKDMGFRYRTEPYESQLTDKAIDKFRKVRKAFSLKVRDEKFKKIIGNPKKQGVWVE
jgi:hypothetical protein